MKYLVTGGNGHLGNAIVKKLQGNDLRVSVRNVHDPEPFRGIDCEVVYADIFDKQSLKAAMQDVEVVIHTAAIFKHWSKDPQKDIIDANKEAAINVLEAARDQKIAKLIYISSMAATDGYADIISEKTWSKRYPNPYFQSKKESEELAWKLAGEYNVPMVTILPSSIVGPHWSIKSLTPMLTFLQSLLTNSLPFDPQAVFSCVHVDDLADAIINAVTMGREGERYLLAHPETISTTRMFSVGKTLNADIVIPKKASKLFLVTIASIMEFLSIFTGKAPALLRGNINFYYRATRKFDPSKAVKELAFSPRDPEEAIKQTMDFLQNNVN